MSLESFSNPILDGCCETCVSRVKPFSKPFWKGPHGPEGEKMNTKVMTALVAAIVVLAGAAVLLTSDRADAAVEVKTLEPMQVQSTGSDTSTFTFNEAEFLGYTYELKIEIAKITNTADPSVESGWKTIGTSTNRTVGGTPSFSAETVSAIDNLTPSLASTNLIGSYTLTVTSNGASGSVNFGIKCTMDALVGAQHQTQTIYYVQPVNIGESTTTTTFTAAEGTVGTFFGQYVSEDESGSHIIGELKDYSWYAVDLPAGLTMSDAGYISGIPLTEGSSSANIVATNKSTGTIYTGTMSIVISPAEPSAPVDWRFEVKVGSAAAVENPSSVNVQKGDEVTLTVYNATVGGSAVEATVKAIDENGAETPLTYETDHYTIPTDGTGSYRISVTYSEDTEYFYLYVTASLANIQAGIIPEGN